MLKNLKQYQEEPLVRMAEQICRWHHERYDGKGYPDGLKGDEIPISAQVVSLADVYDALTNERVYKKAIPHEKAIEMIVAGECGQFNPILIECLLEIKEDIPITVCFFISSYSSCVSFPGLFKIASSMPILPIS